MRILLIFGILTMFNQSSNARDYEISDHYDGKVFFNQENHEVRSFWQVLKWYFTRKAKKWPENVANSNYPLPVVGDSNGVLTFINHASFLLRTPELTIITDPIYSDRTSPLKFIGPKRVREAGIAFENLPAIDVVLVSHNHYDHLDLETLKRLDGKFHPLFLTPLGDRELLLKAGIQNVKEMDWWEEIRIKSTRIIFTPSQHWSARTPFDKCESLWGSYFIHYPGKKIYFAGDSGSGNHFQEIKVRLGAPDIALLPVGAYEPRWFMQNFHMNPAEAVEAHQQLEAELSIGMHLGTFQLTDEGYDEPVIDLKAAREKNKIPADQFRVLDQGESYSF